jgi:hypothetical protein
LSDLVRLRFTGEQPVTFHDHGIGWVEPGGEFSVPASEEERFTRRADVERADGGSGASDDSSASQDGDTSGAGRSGRRGRSGSPSGKGGTGEQ